MPQSLINARQIVEIRDAILERERFVLSSHARPDGDAIGSQLAMAFALRQLGKSARLVNKDPAPPQFQSFPGVGDIEVSATVRDPFDAAIVMECGDLSRTEVDGFDKYFVINIDHHPGNRLFGALNWFDEGAAACAEMVADLIDALGVPLTPEIATHLYLAILTDTVALFFAHNTAHIRDLPALHGGGRPASGDCAGGVRQRHDGSDATDGGRAPRHGD
jgi:phosphoesterase RecJ-like protein